MKQLRYNSILTKIEFNAETDKFRRGSHANDVCDVYGKILGSISDDGLFDLFGEMIASAVSQEKRVLDDGSETEVIYYRSNDGKYMLDNDELYFCGDVNEYLGRVVRRVRSIPRITVLSVLAVLLLVTAILIAVIGIPVNNDTVPVINVTDTDGQWVDGGTVAMFGGKLRPGDNGEYAFVLSNGNDADMAYSFSLQPVYNGQADVAFPILFRLKMNNVAMETTEWKTVDQLLYDDMTILQGSSQSFTLEWQWPFEGGSDANDTLIGAEAGGISLVLRITAQAR